MKSTLLPVLISLGLASATTSWAQLVLVTGSFSGTDSGAAITYNATFSGSYDATDPGIAMTGFSTIIGAVDTFTLTPSTIGGTNFTTGNSGILFSFNDGALVNFVVGGASSGGFDAIGAGTDDFVVYFNPSTLVPTVFLLSRTDEMSLIFAQGLTGSGTLTAVPEPSTYAVMAGLLGLGLALHQRARGLRTATARVGTD
jgi:hypothetical protein